MSGFNTLKVLLVEDNQHMRAIVRTILKGAGIIQVHEAQDGADALESLQHFPADIVIVDFNMAPIDGIDFTRTLRRSTGYGNPMVPVIMMTGHSERSRVEEARDAGVTEFVVKPLTAQALLARINTVVMYPRPYIKSKTFIGPERRRRGEEYRGPERRSGPR